MSWADRPVTVRDLLQGMRLLAAALGWVCVGFSMLGLWLAVFLAVAGPLSWDGLLALLISLPFVGGVVMGAMWRGMPGHDLTLIVLGYVLWVSAAVSLVGLIIWGPFGFFLYAAGVAKLCRERLPRWYRWINARYAVPSE